MIWRNLANSFELQIKIAERDHERDIYKRENQRLRQQLHLIQDEEIVENAVRVSKKSLILNVEHLKNDKFTFLQDLATDETCEQPDEQPEP